MSSGVRRTLLIPCFVVFIVCGAAERTPCQTKLGEPLVIAPENGDTGVGENGGELQFKVGPRSAGASHLFVTKITIPPDAAVTTHLHEIDEEVVYVLDGEVTVTLNGKDQQVGPGGMVYIPPEKLLINSSRQPIQQ
jgi:uncharacterized RmlC-like cupin family protein